MAKLFDIQDTTVAISDLTLAKTRGNVDHAGNLSVAGDVILAGSVTIDTLNVKNIVTESGNSSETGNWTYNSESELNGKGFSWTHGLGSAQLSYRSGGRIWTNANIDISGKSSYNIDDIPVLSAGQLGASITKSNLNTVGTLTKLNVAGDVEIGEFLFVNSTFNRIGIGTDEPNGSLSILDNNVEVVMGSPTLGVGYIGTHSSHDLQIITDNLPRITVKNTGDVNFAGNVHVSGKLTAESVVTDNRIDRTHPLQFSSTRDTSVYGLGLLWTGTGATKQLTFAPNPDRIWSSENIGVAEDKSFYVGEHPVLSANALGPNVLTSNLTTLGVLSELNVSGNTNLSSALIDGGIWLNKSGINSAGLIKLMIQDKEIFYGDSNQINVGDPSFQSKPVKVFGKLSVGINNPDPSVNFSVNGDVKIGGKRFTNAPGSPASGDFQVGDICWNSNPQPNNYIGWVCVVEGSPGQWAGFGMVN